MIKIYCFKVLQTITIFIDSLIFNWWIKKTQELNITFNQVKIKVFNGKRHEFFIILKTIFIHKGWKLTVMKEDEVKQRNRKWIWKTATCQWVMNHLVFTILKHCDVKDINEEFLPFILKPSHFIMDIYISMRRASFEYSKLFSSREINISKYKKFLSF